MRNPVIRTLHSAYTHKPQAAYTHKTPGSLHPQNPRQPTPTKPQAAYTHKPQAAKPLVQGSSFQRTCSPGKATSCPSCPSRPSHRRKSRATWQARSGLLHLTRHGGPAGLQPACQEQQGKYMSQESDTAWKALWSTEKSTAASVPRSGNSGCMIQESGAACQGQRIYKSGTGHSMDSPVALERTHSSICPKV
jgi:hypothetical protein